MDLDGGAYGCMCCVEVNSLAGTPASNVERFPRGNKVGGIVRLLEKGLSRLVGGEIGKTQGDDEIA